MFVFKVTPDDGAEFEVAAGTRDVVTWEKSVKGASLRSLQADQRMTDLYRIAHIAARRQGLYTGTLAEFEAGCDITAEDEEEPDPTNPAP